MGIFCHRAAGGRRVVPLQVKVRMRADIMTFMIGVGELDELYYQRIPLRSGHFHLRTLY
jgi:hypothetical protein